VGKTPRHACDQSLDTCRAASRSRPRFPTHSFQPRRCSVRIYMFTHECSHGCCLMHVFWHTTIIRRAECLAFVVYRGLNCSRAKSPFHWLDEPPSLHRNLASCDPCLSVTAARACTTCGAAFQYFYVLYVPGPKAIERCRHTQHGSGRKIQTLPRIHTGRRH